MPRPCTICQHDRHTEIDAALTAETPYRHIAARYKVSTTSLQRHKAKHFSQEESTIPRLPEKLENLVHAAINGHWELPMSGGGRLDSYVKSWACTYLTGNREEALRHLWDAHALLERYV